MHQTVTAIQMVGSLLAATESSEVHIATSITPCLPARHFDEATRPFRSY